MSSLPRKKPPWNLYTAAKNRLASSLETGVRMLDRLGRTGSDAVQIRVAENEKSGPEILRFLSKLSNSEVRAAVAQNASTSPAIAEELAGDADADVRYAMAANAHTSPALLSILAQDDNPYVSNRAVRTQERLQLDGDSKKAREIDEKPKTVEGSSLESRDENAERTNYG